MSATILPRKVKNITDRRFSRLVARRFLRIQPLGKGGHSTAIWECMCDCGKTCEVMSMNLSSGHTTSCGCRQTENRVKHGMYESAQYRVWIDMVGRCHNEKNSGYQFYGKFGVSVCDSWRGKNGFIHFIEDMGPRPGKLSIDRIDTRGNYEPGNCRWATSKEQTRNTKYNRRVTYEGVTLLCVEWEEVIGPARGVISMLISKRRLLSRYLDKAIAIMKSDGRFARLSVLVN